MTIAKIITIGAEQLIALPAGFHVDAEHVNISKQKNSFVIKVISATENKPSPDMSERQASFLTWRKAYEETIDDSDKQNFDNPWEGLRSEGNGREFNWED